MQILFKKEAGKPHSMRYVRDNGSVAWQRCDDYLIQHDLTHFAVETTMNWRDGFYGMIARGVEITDFEKPKSEKPAIPREAAYAEAMANALQRELSAAQNFDTQNFDESFAVNLGTMKIEPPFVGISEEKINVVRAKIRRLWHVWQNLPIGETLELTF